MTIRQRIAAAVVSRPWLFIVVTLLLTLSLGSGALKIRVQDDLTQVVPPDAPVRLAMTELETTFGRAETVVVMLKRRSGDIFDPDFLAVLVDVYTRLSNARPLARVQGLPGVNRYVRDAQGALSAQPLLAAPPAATEVAALREAIVGDATIRRAFLSQDMTATALYVDPKANADDSDVAAAIADAVAAVGADVSVHTTGMSVVRGATTAAIRHDMMVLVPVVAVVLLGLLAIAFRTFGAVMLTLLIVSFSILPGAGLMGFLGVPLTAINNTFPVLILSIASAGAIHILSIFYLRQREGFTKHAAVLAVVEELTLPVFIAAATTAAGFVSLMTSPLPPIGTLGWVVAVGVIWSWWMSTFVLPAALVLMPERRVSQNEMPLVQRVVAYLADLPLKHSRTLVLFILVSLGVVLALGLPRLKRETRVERFFAPTAPVRIDSDAIDAAFRGSTPLEIIVREDVKDPEVLRRVAAFSKAVQEVEHVGSADSIADVVLRMQEGFTGERKIPDDRTQLAQLLLLFSFSVPPEQYQRFVATDEQSLRITVRMPNLAPDELDATLERIQEIVARELAGLDVAVTGKALFLSELNRMVVRSAVRSMGFSLLLVFVICWFTFRSLREGLEGMSPLFVTVLGIFGIMGLVGVPLTVASALVSAIVIGVGVDYGVHVLARWDLLKGLDHAEHVRKTIAEVGRPILLNALAVGAGLGVLALSQFQPIQQLGMLSVTTMLMAAVGALLIIPLLKTLGRKGA